MNFDQKYEEILDKVADNIYELADTFAEEQIHNFSQWLSKRTPLNKDALKDWADEFVREQRT